MDASVAGCHMPQPQPLYRAHYHNHQSAPKRKEEKKRQESGRTNRLNRSERKNFSSSARTSSRRQPRKTHDWPAGDGGMTMTSWGARFYSIELLPYHTSLILSESPSHTVTGGTHNLHAQLWGILGGKPGSLAKRCTLMALFICHFVLWCVLSLACWLEFGSCTAMRWRRMR